jgi:hypothetical protein
MRISVVFDLLFKNIKIKIYKMQLHMSFHGRETWSLTWWEDYRASQTFSLNLQTECVQERGTGGMRVPKSDVTVD